MANFDDVKKTYLLTQLSKTEGNVFDLEREWLATQVSFPSVNIEDLRNAFFDGENIKGVDPYYNWFTYLKGLGLL
jgi:hypothetical protein